jgi:large subunit ribosomal protein L24
MKIKKGDKVKVITGSDKGTIGEVLKAFPKEDKVIVEGVNLIKKALKPTQANPDGGMIEKETTIHVSNVVLYEEKAKKETKGKKAPAKKAPAKKTTKKTEAKVEETVAEVKKPRAKKAATKE